MATRRLTMAQAIIKFLKNQYVERDGVEQRFFAGCFGIFGHGMIGGIGQALQQNPDFRYRVTWQGSELPHRELLPGVVSIDLWCKGNDGRLLITKNVETGPVS